MNGGMGSRQQPRSQEGPPFSKTEHIHTVVGSDNRPVVPDIDASIQKGFFQVDGKWTCYRRNYFTVTCSFHVKHQPVDAMYFVQRQGRMDAFKRFAVSISAKTAGINNQESEARGLVQHTPKRDKATESTPTVQEVQPAPANATFGAYGLEPHGYGPSQAPGMSYYDRNGRTQSPMPPTAYTFERIQFQKATANNGKRRAQQQYFHVVVELSVDIGGPDGERWLTVAKRQSDQMVVRGRSPGHYKDGARRDRSASMGPDSGSGHGGDTSGGHLPMSSMYGGQSMSGSMDWESTHRNSHPYGGSTYHHASSFSYSPGSGSSATCFNSTPACSESDNPEESDMEHTSRVITHPAGEAFGFRDAGRASLSAETAYVMPSQKRITEDEVFNCASSYSSPLSMPERMSDCSLDIGVKSRAKAVCAS